VGVTVFGKVDLASGSTEEDSDIGAGGGIGRIDFSASAENDEGTFGGWGRIRAGSDGGTPSAWGRMWWKPIQQVTFQIGSTGGDGIYDTTSVVRWGFYQAAGDVGVVVESHAWDTSSWTPGMRDLYSDYVFYGGYGGFGLFLTVNPIDALALNFIIPYGSDALAENTFKKFLGQLTYDIDGIGKVAFTYEGGLGIVDPVKAESEKGDWYFDDGQLVWVKDGDDPADDAVLVPGSVGLPGTRKSGAAKGVRDPGKLYLAFTLTAVENLTAEVGFSYALALTDWTSTKYQDPIGIGLGAKYDMGAFGVKARVLAAVGGSETPDKGDKKDIPLVLTADVLPYYALNDNFKVFFSAGLTYFGTEKDSDDDAIVGWHINPYVEYAFDWSKGFFAGFRVASDGVPNADDKKIITWNVPVGLYFSF